MDCKLLIICALLSCLIGANTQSNASVITGSDVAGCCCNDSPTCRSICATTASTCYKACSGLANQGLCMSACSSSQTTCEKAPMPCPAIVPCNMCPSCLKQCSDTWHTCTAACPTDDHVCKNTCQSNLLHCHNGPAAPCAMLPPRTTKCNLCRECSQTCWATATACSSAHRGDPQGQSTCNVALQACLAAPASCAASNAKLNAIMPCANCVTCTAGCGITSGKCIFGCGFSFDNTCRNLCVAAGDACLAAPTDC